MSDNKRFHVQNYFTTTATTVPDEVINETKHGEIVVMATEDNEKLIIKNSQDNMVTFSSDEKNNEKFVPKSYHGSTTSVNIDTVENYIIELEDEDSDARNGFEMNGQGIRLICSDYNENDYSTIDLSTEQVEIIGGSSELLLNNDGATYNGKKIATVNDIPTVDTILNPNSNNPISNSAVANAISGGVHFIGTTSQLPWEGFQNTTIGQSLDGADTQEYSVGDIIIVANGGNENGVNEPTAEYILAWGNEYDPDGDGNISGYRWVELGDVSPAQDMIDESLKNYYTKSEVNSNIYNPLTAHTSNGVVHVTASQKNTWNECVENLEVLDGVVSEAISDINNKITNIINEDKIVKISYNELYNLKENANLKHGTFYRITDYECTTIQADSRSANHPFDIIVQALDECTLSENAQAIQHEGDEYFADAKLETWQLKYTIDNDASRFAWAKEQIIEQPAKWSCGWGVLEEKNSDDVSSNYEIAIIDGEQKYLYRPVAPNNNFLREKITAEMFYRLIVVSSFTSTDEFIYEADEPIIYNEEGYYEGYPHEIRVKTSDGVLVVTFINEYDNTYYDEDDYDNMMEYPISFKNNEYEEVDGMYYLTPNESDIESWWNNYREGEINTYEREYYNGSADALYYAFSYRLGKYQTGVTMVTDKNHLYQYMDTDYEDWEEEYRTLDYVTYESYIAPRERGKGVIYRLIDEHNNDCPFDFKNMQFLHNSEWYYTFSYFGEDASLGDYCANNHLVIVQNQKDQNTIVTTTIPSLVFNLIHNASDRFVTGIVENDVQTSIAKGFIQGFRISGNKWLPTGGGYNTYFKTFDIYSNGSVYGNIFRGVANNFVVGSADKLLSQFYGNTMTLSIINNFNIRIDCSEFVGNTYDVLISGTKEKSIVGGSIRYCYFDDYGATDTENVVLSFVANLAIANSYIRLFNALTINYENTTSSTTPLRFLNVDARAWDTGASINIPSTFPVNAGYELKIAKNSNGEIKMWCDADLIK